jgi:hypothetical protein
MKKTYINPTMNIVKLNAKSNILAGSDGGVQTSSTVGKEFNGSDISYGRGGIFDEGE